MSFTSHKHRLSSFIASLCFSPLALSFAAAHPVLAVPAAASDPAPAAASVPASVSASAPASASVGYVCPLPGGLLSQPHADTAVVVEGDCVRLQWQPDAAFQAPFRVTHLSADGALLLDASTSHPAVSLILRDSAQTSSVTIASASGSVCTVRLRAVPTSQLHLYLPLAALVLLAGAGFWVYFRKQSQKLEGKRQELEAGNKRQTQKYDFATVLFADIQGFTRIAEHMNPEKLVDELDRYFIHFDELVDRYGVEKIKTIGDAYMCAGGVPDRDSANPIEVLLVGLGMIAYVNERRASDKGFWNIRVGINTGPVIAGRLGNIKKSFDIWGDSVNTASRMESGGEPGKVNISGTTYQKIQDYFDCEYRGQMPVKYKGEVDMYFVNRLKEEYCQPGSTFLPNALLMRRLQRMRISDFEEKVKANLLLGLPANIGARMDMFLSRVDTLAHMEHLSDDEAVVGGVAAIFCFVQHEFPKDVTVLGRAAVAEQMRKLHLPDDFKDQIGLVVAHIGQGKHPENTVEEVIYDAFSEPYGRKDFIRLLVNHYDDVVARGYRHSRTAWFNRHRQQLAEHVFHTDSAKRLREVPQDKQIEQLDLAISVL